MLKNLPDINFATADVDELTQETVKLAEKILGRSIAKADPVFLLIKIFLNVICQQRLLIDQTAKQNLLAYATGDALDHLAALVGVERLPASAATVHVRVKLSTSREQVTTIKKGTRITADDQIFFALDEAVLFLSGTTSMTATATCTTEGIAGNGFAPDELNRIVDPQPFLLSITNTTTSDGGSDIESDDSLRERIHIAPEKFSCAGSAGAYAAHTKDVSTLIADVYVTSPVPGDVEVYPLMTGGELPSDEMLLKIFDHLDEKTIRPLTDTVRVLAPAKISYDLDADYFISYDDAAQASTIQANVQAAVDDFIGWQRGKLGLDINPSKFIALLMAAGAKRVEVRAPAFVVVNDASVAVPATVSVNFAGFETD